MRIVKALLLAIALCLLPASSFAASTSVPESPDFSIPPGAVVSHNGTIFLIMNGQQIPFATWDAFVGLGYAASNVKNIDLSNRRFVQTNGIFTRHVPHTWGSWLLHKGTVYYSHEDGLIPVPSWDTFLENGGFSSAIMPANKYDLEILATQASIPPLVNWDSRVWLFAPPQAQARDAERIARVETVRNALRSYYQKYTMYPSSVRDMIPEFLGSLPPAVLPPDGTCNTTRNSFRYRKVDTGYEVGFCLGSSMSNFVAGDNIVGP